MNALRSCIAELRAEFGSLRLALEAAILLAASLVAYAGGIVAALL